MATVHLGQHLRRHVSGSDFEAAGATVGDVLRGAFSQCPELRGYVLDDQGHVRKHVAIFANSEPINDREGLADAVSPGAEIYIMQALSGG